jgi:hypothetical protein
MNIWLTEFMGLLADACARADNWKRLSLRSIERATDCGSTFDMAELLRVKALVLATMPQHGRDAAMNCLTEACHPAPARPPAVAP